jgi:endonuclease/exonuclease/phosphatase family metal-dependent hydrolase
MPFYADMTAEPREALARRWADDPPGRARAIARLKALRAALDASGPPRRTLNATLVLGTWNVREFDAPSWGQRLPESYAYLAEIIDRFDLVALQEVRDDLRALDALVARLGRHWTYLVSDVTEGRPGNRERLAFLYDTRKVHFLGMAGELVLPPVTRGGATVPAAQVARTPLMAAFQVGWTKFVLATVHIVYGTATAEPAARVEEIRQVAEFLRKRTEIETEPVRNIVILGDFNIFTAGDRTMKALIDEGGFTLPPGIRDVPGTNVAKDKRYDQIAFRAREGRFEATGLAGMFDYYEHVFTEADEAVYRPYIDAYIASRHADGFDTPKQPGSAKAATTQYKMWRTFQMSDHLPLWVELRVDFADDYLSELAAQSL